MKKSSKMKFLDTHIYLKLLFVKSVVSIARICNKFLVYVQLLIPTKKNFQEFNKKHKRLKFYQDDEDEKNFEITYIDLRDDESKQQFRFIVMPILKSSFAM